MHPLDTADSVADRYARLAAQSAEAQRRHDRNRHLDDLTPTAAERRAILRGVVHLEVAALRRGVLTPVGVLATRARIGGMRARHTQSIGAERTTAPVGQS